MTDGMESIGDEPGIKVLFTALATQIYRRIVVSLCAKVPLLLRLHRPVIERGKYRLLFSPTRFSMVLYRYPRMEREDEDFLARFLEPGMTYVDVGANIGTTTLAGADAVGPSGRVIAFEPHPRTFRDLSDSVAVNPDLSERITLINCAVGDCPGTAAISDLRENDVNHIDESGIPVPMTTLDDALAGIARIDLLKIDVEGYEKNVLRGARETLNRTDAVYFESCEANFAQFGYSADDLFELLEGRGFSCYAVDRKGGLTEVGRGRRCTQGYENLLAYRDGRVHLHRAALDSVGSRA